MLKNKSILVKRAALSPAQKKANDTKKEQF